MKPHFLQYKIFIKQLSRHVITHTKYHVCQHWESEKNYYNIHSQNTRRNVKKDKGKK